VQQALHAITGSPASLQALLQAPQQGLEAAAAARTRLTEWPDNSHHLLLQKKQQKL
jgi:hypothetical protein